MDKKVIITADSSCDLSKELIEENKIEILPLFCTLGDQTYSDGVDCVPTDIFAYVAKTGTLPKTAARSVADFIDFFKKYTDEGYEIVHIDISSEFSSMYQNACIAASELEGVYVVDSRNLSSGVGHVVLKACDFRDEGFSAAEIAEKLEYVIPRVSASFILFELDYMVKGGRCSGVAALGANLLKIRPCIEVRNGKMEQTKKYRGSYEDCIRKYMNDRLTLDGVKYDRKRAFCTSTIVDPALAEFSTDIVRQSGLFDNVYCTYAGCTVASHCGKNTVGVLFITDEPLYS